MNVLKVIGCSMTLCALPLSGQTGGGTELFRDMKAPQHERIMDLLSRLTVEEKISLLVNDAPAIGRLGIDKYNHGNEALHGVVRPGDFTVFPQAIGMAAMWNPELLYRISSAISDEARGRWKELEYGKKQIAGASDLLTFWSPTVNMARDPRWGTYAGDVRRGPLLERGARSGFCERFARQSSPVSEDGFHAEAFCGEQ